MSHSWAFKGNCFNCQCNCVYPCHSCFLHPTTIFIFFSFNRMVFILSYVLLKILSLTDMHQTCYISTKFYFVNWFRNIPKVYMINCGKSWWSMQSPGFSWVSYDWQTNHYLTALNKLYITYGGFVYKQNQNRDFYIKCVSKYSPT